MSKREQFLPDALASLLPGHEPACECARCEAGRAFDRAEQARALAMEGAVGPSKADAIEAYQAEIARRDAMRPAAPVLPASQGRNVRVGKRVYRGAVQSEGRRLCEPGCECVECHRPSKDAGERVRTTGRPIDYRAAMELARHEQRIERERYRLARGRKPRNG